MKRKCIFFSWSAHKLFIFKSIVPRDGPENALFRRTVLPYAYHMIYLHFVK